jgi:tRNA threonylcarbamoyladenosine biosynthesis protein TsaE
MTIRFNLEEINTVAKQILAVPSLKKVITFHAAMGAGKTTLIKEIVKELGVKDNSSSPTFSLVNEYRTHDGDIVYHFDLYRLNSEEEGYDMGLDEYFYSEDWCFIEWPEKTPNLIPIDHAHISIKVLADGNRELVLKN